MTYTAELGIQTQGDVDWLEFTLYHGYTVQEAKLGEQNLPWKREGDLLRLKWPGGKKEGTVVLRVEGSPGSGGVLKPQAIYLPSGFPWYPIPGKWRVAEACMRHPRLGINFRVFFLIWSLRNRRILKFGYLPLSKFTVTCQRPVPTRFMEPLQGQPSWLESLWRRE